MHSNRLSALALLCFAFAAHAVPNQWSTLGPFGGYVNDVLIDPANSAIAYAAAQYGLFKSTDGGISWSALSQDFGQYPITDIAFDPSNSSRLYVAGLSAGLFRSVDGGGSFTRISAVPTDANIDGPWGLGISADGQTLYYSTIGSKFFRSTDGGASFSERTSMPSASQMIVVDPANSAVVYAANGPKLLKSINGGGSWTELPLPAGNVFATSIVLVPGTPNTLWLSTSNDIFSTQDDGAIWTPSGQFLNGRRLHADASTPGGLYATLSFEGGVIRRYSGGVWQFVFTGLPAVVDKLAVSPVDPTEVSRRHEQGRVSYHRRRSHLAAL